MCYHSIDPKADHKVHCHLEPDNHKTHDNINWTRWKFILALTIIYLISCVNHYSYALTYNLVISISKSTYQAWAQTCLKEITGTYVISRVIISWILDIHTIDSEFNIFARRCYDSPMALFERLISRRSLSSEWSRSNRSHINRLTATVSWTCCK